MAKRVASKKTTSNKVTTRSIVSWIVLAFAAVFLLLANGSAWVKNTVFDQNQFRAIAVSTIQQQDNRDAIANKVTDAALEDRPVVKRLVGDRVSAFTSGLLASDIGERVLNGVTTKLYSYVIDPNPQDVELQLTVIKQPLSILTNLAQSYGQKVDIDPDSIPNTLVLVKAKDVPNISSVYRTFIWLAPIFWLLSFIGFAVYIYINRSEYAKYVYRAYAAVVAVVIIGLSAGPFLPQSVGSLVPDIYASTVVTSLVDNFLAPFTVQMWTLLAIATLAVIIFSQRARIAHGGQSLLAKLPNTKGKV